MRQIKQEARQSNSVNHDLAELIVLSSDEVTNNLKSEPVNSKSCNKYMR